ncbi:MAG: ABC transporter ATP-binding protein [Geminicoccaceae bacterium]
MTEPSLALAGIKRSFRQAGDDLHVLRGIDLALEPGKVAALVGASGAGKSTLLHIAGLLERPTAGQVFVGGTDCSKLGERPRTNIRREQIGFVYQFHHLLPEFTALENVSLPQLFNGQGRWQASGRAEDLLTAVGLAARTTHRPGQLSGGEQQRVAIARALANNPRVLLADEPTGNLDEATADRVFDLLIDQIRHSGASALIATHDTHLAAKMDQQFVLHGGFVERER